MFTDPEHPIKHHEPPVDRLHRPFVGYIVITCLVVMTILLFTFIHDGLMFDFKVSDCKKQLLQLNDMLYEYSMDNPNWSKNIHKKHDIIYVIDQLYLLECPDVDILDAPKSQVSGYVSQLVIDHPYDQVFLDIERRLQ